MHSENFSEKELACHHCGVNGVQQELLDVLETFRAAVGRPVVIDDAYRCPVHNAAVGGAPLSEHVRGIAADISVPGMTAAQLEATARRIPAIHGIGRDDHFGYIHIDTRETAAQWCYATQGELTKTVAYYPAGVQA